MAENPAITVNVTEKRGGCEPRPGSARASTKPQVGRPPAAPPVEEFRGIKA